MLLHLDPSTPTGLLDTLGHLLPLFASAGSTLTTLLLGVRADKRRK